MAKRNVLKGTTNIMVVISLTIALFLIGTCGSLSIVANKFAQNLRENIELNIELEDGLERETLDSIYTELAKKSYVLVIKNSPQIQFVSKKQAGEEFIKEWKEDYTKILKDENPLFNFYKIKIKLEYFQEAKLKSIKTDLEAIDGVHEVYYPQNFVKELNSFFGKIYTVLSVFIILLLVVLVFLVNNTIKMAIYSQRFLIRSMQFIGASNSFISKPFVVNGVIQGFIAGLLSCSLLLFGLFIMETKFSEANLSIELTNVSFLCLFLIILGVLIGTLSTLQAMERYLKITLDELY